MNLKQSFKALEEFGKLYEREYLHRIATESLTTDWFSAFDFFLGHTYFQGRRDALSLRFKEAAMTTLDEHFGSDPQTRISRFRDAIHSGIIPTDHQWNTWTNNPLFLDLQRRKAGKRRDIEMVLDSLQFLTSIPSYNIVLYSISEIRAGRIQQLYLRLNKIRQVGQKVASFYLRDLISCYKLKVSEDDYFSVQPLDTWVLQVAKALGVCSDNDSTADAVQKILQVCRQFGVDPKRINSGAWYLGANSFKVVISCLRDKRPLPWAKRLTMHYTTSSTLAMIATQHPQPPPISYAY